MGEVVTNHAMQLRAFATEHNLTIQERQGINAAADEIERLHAALKKFGRHPTGDMEGVGRCAGFRLAAPFREDLCDCGLNAVIDERS